MADAEVGGQLAHQPSPIPEKNEKDAVLTVDSSRDVILIDWEENDPEVSTQLATP
jgi:hypothetical protein